MTSYEANAERAAKHGWDIEPRGHDYQQALWLWVRGYRRNRWATHGWRLRLLVPYGKRNRFAEVYTTLRTFEAFRAIEAQYAKQQGIKVT